MPGGRKGYTTPHRCMTVADNKRNRPSQRDFLARCRLQSKIADTPIQFHAPIYLGLGIETKTDIYYKFAHDKTISIELDLPFTENPLLLHIKQEGKQPIITTDFYFTNIKPSDLIIPAPHVNNDHPSSPQAAASDLPTFQVDPM